MSADVLISISLPSLLTLSCHRSFSSPPPPHTVLGANSLSLYPSLVPRTQEPNSFGPLSQVRLCATQPLSVTRLSVTLRMLLDFVSIKSPRHHLILSNSGVEDSLECPPSPFFSLPVLSLPPTAPSFTSTTHTGASVGTSVTHTPPPFFIYRRYIYLHYTLPLACPFDSIRSTPSTGPLPQHWCV